MRAMQDFEFVSPSLDLGCGDGVFSFLRAGGQFPAAFDVFSVSSLDKYFEAVDVYDAAVKVETEIHRGPRYKIDIGVDHKANLLRKAEVLGLYSNLLEADLNSHWPFPDGTIASLFSNIIYWLDDPAHAFAEVRRILRKGGKACVLLPDVTLRDYSFYWSLCVKPADERFRFLEDLDRGRLADNIKQAKTFDEWKKLMLASGLSIDRHRQYLPKHVVQIWDVGLRPLFPVLYKLASAADKNLLPAIKEEWINTFERFFVPLLKLEGPGAFHYFMLSKP